MRTKTYRTALGGITSALALVFLFLGGVLPFASILGPVLSSMVVEIFMCEFGKKNAFIMYISVSVLSLLIAPDRECALLFLFFLGWYPMFKEISERKLNRIPCFLSKIAALNISVGLMYWLLIHVLGMSDLAADFAAYTAVMYVILIVLANITFLLADRLYTKMAAMYFRNWRAKLVRK